MYMAGGGFSGLTSQTSCPLSSPCPSGYKKVLTIASAAP